MISSMYIIYKKMGPSCSSQVKLVGTFIRNLLGRSSLTDWLPL